MFTCPRRLLTPLEICVTEPAIIYSTFLNYNLQWINNAMII